MLTKAVRNHFSIEIEHRTPAKKSYLLRRVDPYKLWYTNGGLYLIAWDHRKGQYLVFAIERIRSVQLTNIRFTERPDFDFDKLRETAFNMIWESLKRSGSAFPLGSPLYQGTNLACLRRSLLNRATEA